MVKNSHVKIGVVVFVLIVTVIGVTKALSLKNLKYSTQKTSSPTDTKNYIKNAEDRESQVLVALGSSTTKANNLSSNLKGDNPEYSFATGTKINSLFLHLKQQRDNFIAVNLAESGATSYDVLQKQVPQAISYQPAIITIDIMADILSTATPTAFKTNLKKIVDEIKDQNTTILIASYPNFSLLRTALHSACQEDTLGVGVDQLSTEKIRSYNQIIQELASEQNLIFVDLYNTLSPDDVSNYDCIHPNIEGQQKLAEAWILALEKGEN